MPPPRDGPGPRLPRPIGGGPQVGGKAIPGPGPGGKAAGTGGPPGRKRRAPVASGGRRDGNRLVPAAALSGTSPPMTLSIWCPADGFCRQPNGDALPSVTATANRPQLSKPQWPQLSWGSSATILLNFSLVSSFSDISCLPANHTSALCGLIAPVVDRREDNASPCRSAAGSCSSISSISV